jgi:hypothetical protein
VALAGFEEVNNRDVIHKKGYQVNRLIFT